MAFKKFGLWAATFSAAAFLLPVSPVSAYYASSEHGSTRPPAAIESLNLSTEQVYLPDAPADETLTPEGNLSLVDDLLQSVPYSSVETELENKQFITVQSKSGNYFYLVIDRSGDSENVYFLNLVDEADLMALIEDGDRTPSPVVCICIERCTAGHVDTGCPVCKERMVDCTGKEPVSTVPQPESSEIIPEPVPEPQKDSGNRSLIVPVILLLAAAAGGVVYYFKFREAKPQTKGTDDLYTYDFGDEKENEDYEEEFENSD